VVRQGLNGQHQQALVLLLQALGAHLHTEECDVVFLAAAEPEPAGFLRRIGFSTTEPVLWRYGPKETPPVRLLHLDCRVSGALGSLMYLSWDSSAKAA
jgi:hypothetical protein